MKIICAECGSEMDTMSPGSNDPCIRVKPCCGDPDAIERLNYLEKDLLNTIVRKLDFAIDEYDNTDTLEQIKDLIFNAL